MGTISVPLARRHFNGAHADSAPLPARPNIAECELPHASSTRVHQRCVIELVHDLESFLKDSPVGVAFSAPAGVSLDGEVYTPDISVIGLVDGVVATRAYEGDPLLLAVEVQSPWTARCDRLHKRTAYLRAEAVYWIVDPDARLVDRWLPGASRPDVLDDELFWFPQGAREPLVIDLDAFFARVFRCFPASMPRCP